MSKQVMYRQDSDRDNLDLIQTVREGVDYYSFSGLLKKVPFTLSEWSRFLNISERTLQRYKKEQRKFNPLQSEKIIQISLLYQYGIEVYGDARRFDNWLQTGNPALGGVKPKELLDNSFGINLVRDELTRIEHGVLA